MIWSLTRVCPAGAHVHSHCSNDSCAQWQRSHICYYTFVNNIHFKNAWFIYTLPKVGPSATSNMAHHWYYEPGWMWLETAAAKQAYQAIQDSLMQTVKPWWAFDWCVQQRELKRCEVWGLSRQSFHLNQPCLQCFCVNKSQAFLSERHTEIKLRYVQEWEKALSSSITADVWPLSNEQT